MNVCSGFPRFLSFGCALGVSRLIIEIINLVSYSLVFFASAREASYLLSFLCNVMTDLLSFRGGTPTVRVCLLWLHWAVKFIFFGHSVILHHVLLTFLNYFILNSF